MRHFVRFAKVSASGSVDRVGWRLRIFLTSREAGAFAEELAGKLWRVEIGQYEDGEAPLPPSWRAAFAPRRCAPTSARDAADALASLDKPKGWMVGVAGFEPTTPCPPDKCANRAALHSDGAPYRHSARRRQCGAA